MRVIRSSEKTPEELQTLLTRRAADEVEVSSRVQARTMKVFGEPLTPLQVVAKIFADVRQSGDSAVEVYSRKIDGADLSAENFFASEEEYAAAREEIAEDLSGEFGAALSVAKNNIRKYHEKQLRNSWITTEADGVVLGQKITALDSVAVYVPGGSAPLVSSVLMGVVPAKVAGVKNVIVATPVGADCRVNPYVLVAAREAGADAVLKVGGAQAVAALAFGTEKVPKVDKVVGPGNIYVTLAKKMAFGRIGVESLAGPSEILVIADKSANPRYVAADLLSQAEHDPEAGVVLVTDSEDLVEAVATEIELQKEKMPRRDIIEQALEKSGIAIVCGGIEEACELANFCAPEHLELLVSDPYQYLEKVRHAGAIFIGHYSCEPIGDYVAGPNHVLPTNGTARFSSPLGVDDFVKKTSLIGYTRAGIDSVGPHGIRLAEVEGLEAHANAIRVRLEGGRGNE